MIQYYISYQYPHQHFIDIKMVVNDLDQDQAYLQLPTWRPGRYQLANYAKNIQKFEVLSDGKEVPCRKVSKDRWVVDTKDIQSIEVHYNYYAAQLDAGGSWLDNKQLYINFVNCLLLHEGREEDQCRVYLDLPEKYKIACGLPEIEPHVLAADNYSILVDSPMMASDTLRHKTYQVQGTPFHIWIQGNWKPDWEALLEEFERFTKKQVKLMGEFPAEDYHFLFQMLPYRHYHGVEHANSTVIVLGPDFMLYEENYQDFLSVSSHELFHAWNICKIRPKELLPYDLTKENYFDTGFVVEGLTSYYGDIFLVRSGVWDFGQFLKEFNRYVIRHFQNFGRFNLSLTDSSWDLWLDGYEDGIPNRKVSIYSKGALVALILDLQLRLDTKHQKSLDDVMVLLWERFGKVGKGYTLQDYKALVEEVAGKNMDDYFDRFVHGTEPLEDTLNDLLEAFGCMLITKFINTGVETFSFQTQISDGMTLIKKIVPHSNASKVLSIDDEIIAINGRKVEGNISEHLTNQNKIEMTLFRNKELVQVELEAEEKRHFAEKLIKYKGTSINAEQLNNFKSWITG